MDLAAERETAEKKWCHMIQERIKNFIGGNQDSRLRLGGGGRLGEDRTGILVDDDLHDHRSSSSLWNLQENTKHVFFSVSVHGITHTYPCNWTSLPTNQTGNRQITLAGTTREPRAYLLTLPGPLPAPASELRAGRWVKVGDRGSRPQPGSGRAVTGRDRRGKAGRRHRAAWPTGTQSQQWRSPAKATPPAAAERALNRAARQSRKAGD